MPVATFDTLKFSKALREAGVPEKQADAEAVVMAEVLSLNFREVATKDDLKATKDELKSELKTELKLLEERFDFKLKDLEQRFDFKLKELEQRLDLKFERLDAKIERFMTKTTGDFVLLKWMFGAVMTLLIAVLGIVVRLMLFPAK